MKTRIFRLVTLLLLPVLIMDSSMSAVIPFRFDMNPPETSSAVLKTEAFAEPALACSLLLLLNLKPGHLKLTFFALAAKTWRVGENVEPLPHVTPDTFKEKTMNEIV